MFKLLKPCSTHGECNDDDPSDADECLSEASTCLCKCNNDCEEHGQMLYVNVTVSHANADDIYFHLKDDDGDVVLNGGPYCNEFIICH